MGLQANVPQPYDDDEEGVENNTTADDIEAALTDLQVALLYFIPSDCMNKGNTTRQTQSLRIHKSLDFYSSLVFI